MKHFKILPYEEYDKFVHIEGPDGFSLKVNYDDVDHKIAKANMKKMVKILNDNWNKINKA